MAEKQVKKVFDFIGKNPELVQQLPSIAQNFLPSLSPTPSVPPASGLSGAVPLNDTVVSSLQQVASIDNVTESMSSISLFNRTKNIVIIFLIFWGIALIVSRFMVEDEKKKKDIEFINNVLVGQTGIIPVIISIWVVGVLVVTLLPSLLGVLPRVGDLSNSLSSFLSNIAGQLPSLLKLVS